MTPVDIRVRDGSADIKTDAGRYIKVAHEQYKSPTDVLCPYCEVPMMHIRVEAGGTLGRVVSTAPARKGDALMTKVDVLPDDRRLLQCETCRNQFTEPR